MNDNRFEGLESASDRCRQAKRQMERGMMAEAESGLRLNDWMLAAVVVIAAVISFTDFTFSFGNFRNLTALTLFLYIVTMFVYRNRYEKGKRRGREDAEYRRTLKDYREKRNGIYEQDLAGRVPAFCADYRRQELREYRESLLLDIDMDYEEYKSVYLRMSERQIMSQKISAEAKAVLIKCNKATAVRLTPGLLLNENGESDRHKLIGQSGREREKSDRKREAVSRAVYVLFGAMVAVDVIFHFSFLTVAQWIVRMLPVVMAVMSGDDSGYCNITVTETTFKQNQTKVLSLFNEWIAKDEEREGRV